MRESEIAERIAARRAELDDLEGQLAKQLAEVRAERDELAVAERVWHRMTEQLADEQPVAAPVTAQLAGRSVLLVRTGTTAWHGRDRAAAGVPAHPGLRPPGRAPVATRAVGEALGSLRACDKHAAGRRRERPCGA